MYLNPGLGSYQRIGNWSWEFYPPPYDFLAPPASAPRPGSLLPEERDQPTLGLGCGATCSCNKKPGMGDIPTDLSAIANDIAGGNWTQLATDFGVLLQEPTLVGIPLWAAAIGLYFAWETLSSHSVQVGRRSRARR
jgi:hypothetical protein